MGQEGCLLKADPANWFPGQQGASAAEAGRKPCSKLQIKKPEAPAGSLLRQAIHLSGYLHDYLMATLSNQHSGEEVEGIKSNSSQTRAIQHLKHP